MKNIKGHVRRSYQDLMEFFTLQKSFTYSLLPHNRYNQTREACTRMIRKGYAEVVHTKRGVQQTIKRTKKFEDACMKDLMLGTNDPT